MQGRVSNLPLFISGGSSKGKKGGHKSQCCGFDAYSDYVGGAFLSCDGQPEGTEAGCILKVIAGATDKRAKDRHIIRIDLLQELPAI